MLEVHRRGAAFKKISSPNLILITNCFFFERVWGEVEWAHGRKHRSIRSSAGLPAVKLGGLTARARTPEHGPENMLFGGRSAMGTWARTFPLGPQQCVS